MDVCSAKHVHTCNTTMQLSWHISGSVGNLANLVQNDNWIIQRCHILQTIIYYARFYWGAGPIENVHTASMQSNVGGISVSAPDHQYFNAASSVIAWSVGGCVSAQEAPYADTGIVIARDGRTQRRQALTEINLFMPSRMVRNKWKQVCIMDQ